MLDGSSTGDSTQSNLGVSFGVNGFLGHPALGAFRSWVDLLALRTEAAQDINSSNVGFGLDLNVLPRGSYPMSLYAHRRLYDYSGIGKDDPYSSYRSPESGTDYGARFRFRKGFLSGTFLGFDRSATEYSGSDSPRDVLDNQFIDWSRALGGLQNHLRVERRARDYTTVRLGIEDIITTFEQHGEIAPRWRWELWTVGIRREVASYADPGTRSNDLRLRSRLAREVRTTDLLDVVVTNYWFSSEAAPSADSYGLSVSYRWRPRPGWEFGPFAEYDLLTSDDTTVRTPLLGVQGSWERRAGLLSTLISAQASRRNIDEETDSASLGQSENAYAASGTLSHGETAGFRKNFEIEVVRNEIRTSGTPILELPDLGYTRGFGAEDLDRLRFSLGHSWDSRGMELWIDWSARKSGGSIAAREHDARTVSGNAQVGGRHVNLTASMGQTDLDRASGESERVRFVGAEVTWRPWRAVALRGAYRSDLRDLAATPDATGDRIETGLNMQAGFLLIDLNAFAVRQRVDGGPEISQRGFTWMIRRQFSGWLPIVTGMPRNGVIR